MAGRTKSRPGRLSLHEDRSIGPGQTQEGSSEVLSGSPGTAAGTFQLFERATLQVTLQAGESNDSYLTGMTTPLRILGEGVTVEDIGAYILIWQSGLSMEDRKRIIKGKLTHAAARKGLRLLGAKLKAHDTYAMEEEEEIHMTQDRESGGYDEETTLQVLLDEGDEHTHFCHDFEDQILLACQESTKLASCFTTYQEARQKIRHKARSRGFWPVTSSFNKGKGRSKGKSKSNKRFTLNKRRNLADRIANSICQKCMQPDHWKRECPNPPHPSYQNKQSETITKAARTNYQLGR